MKEAIIRQCRDELLKVAKQLVAFPVSIGTDTFNVTSCKIVITDKEISAVRVADKWVKVQRSEPFLSEDVVKGCFERGNVTFDLTTSGRIELKELGITREKALEMAKEVAVRSNYRASWQSGRGKHAKCSDDYTKFCEFIPTEGVNKGKPQRKNIYLKIQISYRGPACIIISFHEAMNL